MSGSHGHDEPLPEPKTPMWLPAVGVVLFSAAGIWWALQPSDTPVADNATIAAASAAAPSPPPTTAVSVQAQPNNPRQPSNLPPGATVLHPRKGPNAAAQPIH